MERQRHRKSVDGDHDDEAIAPANAGMIELPEGYIATVISLTSPCDAYLLSCVNSLFKLATESDAIWDRFLPADYGSLICNLNFCSSSSAMSKKELHLRSLQLSRFPEVAELIHVQWFEIRGEINTSILSPRTTYGAYLVFTMVVVAYGFVNHAVEVSFELVGSDSHKRAVYLDLERGQRPRHAGEKNAPEMSVMEVTCGNWKAGLIVQGIEIRPKFPEVAKLIHMWWLEIRNETNTSILSPRTTYGAYLVFKMVVVAYGFVNQAAEVSFGLIGSDSHKRAVYLDLERGQRPRQVKFPRRISIPIRSLEWQVYVPKEIDGYYRKERGDGWLEIELGKGVGKKNVLKMSVMKVTISNWKGGLSVQGIEIRPKQSK
ncbi:hypothetical protein ACOSQ4_013976 [Xanthoceras sorbifolium]